MKTLNVVQCDLMGQKQIAPKIYLRTKYVLTHFCQFSNIEQSLNRFDQSFFLVLGKI
jgi:hypothetical protein